MQLVSSGIHFRRQSWILQGLLSVVPVTKSSDMLFTVAGETSEGTKPATPAGKDESAASEEQKEVKEERKDEQVRLQCFVSIF